MSECTIVVSTNDDYYQTLKWASAKHGVNISALADINLLKLYCLERQIKVNGDNFGLLMK